MKNCGKNLLAQGLIAVLSIALAAATGCNSSNTKGLTSVSVTPTSPSISVGGTQQFSARGTYGDGSTQTVTGSVVWVSSDKSVATIAANGGMATGVGPGTTIITATSGSVTSSPVTLTVNVVPTLTSIAIQPVAPDVAVNGTEQLEAWGTYDDGSRQNITDSVAWSSSDVDVAAITENSGMATGVAPGTTTIVASSEGLSATAVLTVYLPISAISITPLSQTLATTTSTTPAPFIVTGTVLSGGTVDISSGATLTVYLSGIATADITCSYNATGPAGPGQYCTGDGSESTGTYQVVASYTGTTITATATLNVQ